MEEPGQTEIDDQPVVEVEVASLSVADSPRISGEDPEHIEVLAAAHTQLPPIIVHRATMSVIDGLHRLRVAKLRGQHTIAVRFFGGDEADAFVLAVKSNITHGLPLSVADRKHAAGRIIDSHPQWSDRRVASVTGIAPATVAEIRRRATGQPNASRTRIGQDGRVRPVDGTQGRRLASELISDNPSLSLRQVAQKAGISPETARDVRNRMRRGEDPLAVRQRKSRGPTSNGTNPPGQRSAPGSSSVLSQASARDRAAAVERLKADPALRLTETGRILLRLLNIHMIDSNEWQKIVDNLPPHCSDIVVQLSKDCADVWTEFAGRIEHKADDMAQAV